jgi:hypothetical protein
MPETGEQLSFLSGEAAQQDAAHRKIEQHFTGLNQVFVVLGQPPVGGKPRQCSLHHRPYNGAKFPDAREAPTGLNSQVSEVHAEGNFNVVAVDLDPSHHGSDQGLLASPVQIVQPVLHPSGKLFKATDHQRQFTVGVSLLCRQPALLFEPSPARFQACDARLELASVLSLTGDSEIWCAVRCCQDGQDRTH